jgi:hypothetical protein
MSGQAFWALAVLLSAGLAPQSTAAGEAAALYHPFPFSNDEHVLMVAAGDYFLANENAGPEQTTKVHLQVEQDGRILLDKFNCCAGGTRFTAKAGQIVVRAEGNGTAAIVDPNLTDNRWEDNATLDFRAAPYFAFAFSRNTEHTGICLVSDRPFSVEIRSIDFEVLDRHEGTSYNGTADTRAEFMTAFVESDGQADIHALLTRAPCTTEDLPTLRSYHLNHGSPAPGLSLVLLSLIAVAVSRGRRGI